jgi:hypothetical protein
MKADKYSSDDNNDGERMTADWCRRKFTWHNRGAWASAWVLFFMFVALGGSQPGSIGVSIFIGLMLLAAISWIANWIHANQAKDELWTLVDKLLANRPKRGAD